MQDQRLEHIKQKEAARKSQIDAYNKKHYVDPGVLTDDQLQQRGLLELKAKEDDATSKSTPKPDADELVTFVEDGLNRKSKPKPQLGTRRPAAKKKKKRKGPVTLLDRNLAQLKTAGSVELPAALSLFVSNESAFTEFLVVVGVGASGSSGLASLAAASRALAIATRTPDYRRLSVSLAAQRGLLAIDLQPGHPAAVGRSMDQWKQRMAELWTARDKFGPPGPPPRAPNAPWKDKYREPRGGTGAAYPGDIRGQLGKSTGVDKHGKAHLVRDRKGSVGNGNEEQEKGAPTSKIEHRTDGARLDSKKREEFKMQVIVRLRPSKMTAEEKAAEAEANKKATFFLPLHQRLELEKLGHATGLEAEVHAKMNTGGGKSLEEQKASRESISDQSPSAPQTGAGLEAAKAAKKSKGGNKKVTNDELIAIMAEGLVEEEEYIERVKMTAKIVDVTEGKKILVSLPGQGLRYFEYAAVMSERDDQAKAYVTSAVPALEAFLQGFSACLFVYGQTGSGKTHTMFGADGALDTIVEDAARISYTPSSKPLNPGDVVFKSIDPRDPFYRTDKFERISKDVGIVPRVLVDLMGVVESSGMDATITINYIEIYNDELTDLFSGDPVTLYRVGVGQAADEVRAAGRDLGDNAYQLKGASDLTVTSVRDVLNALAAGEENKHKAATAMNERSSRAHTVFMIQLTQRHKGAVIQSRLHLVDLGGSEQIKRSKAEGQRLKEAIGINSSLMVLGKCIDALTNKAAHVPYYESKLTMLLQPALGGNARTTVLVTGCADQADADETVHALRFGERCSQISNDVSAATASMAEVMDGLDKALAECTAAIKDLTARGGKEAYEDDVKRLEGGQGMNTAAAQSQKGTASYAVVEDLAGEYRGEMERMTMLQARKREITGAQVFEEEGEAGFATGPRKAYAEGF